MLKSRPFMKGGPMTILTTPRLLLRPFEEGDAAELYDYARDPRVGPIAGWPPHTSVENSREIIRTVFSAHNVFAVADRESGRVIGSAGFVGEHREELPGPDDELGYALSPAFWGRGLIPEASGALIRWGFTELGLETIWCNHYDGNTRSRRVLENCGFRYQFSRETDVPLMGERRLTHFFALTRPQWAADGGEDRR